MINPEHKLSIRRQSELLEMSRSMVYYRPRPMPDADLMLMRRIDELHMNYPFAGLTHVGTEGIGQEKLNYELELN